jgi:hypothetical protein
MTTTKIRRHRVTVIRASVQQARIRILAQTTALHVSLGRTITTQIQARRAKSVAQVPIVAVGRRHAPSVHLAKLTLTRSQPHRAQHAKKDGTVVLVQQHARHVLQVVLM